MRSSTRQLVFAGSFCLLNVIVGVAFVDLYPFTSMPMFSDSTEHIATIEIRTPAGERLRESAFGVHNWDLRNPTPRIGRSPGPSIHAGQILERDVLERQLRAKARELGLDFPYLDVVQVLIAPCVVDGAQVVGEVRQERWRISLGGR